MTTIETPSVIRHLWKSVLALGVLTLVLGAAVLIWPGDSIVVASVVFGVYLLVSGIAQPSLRSLSVCPRPVACCFSSAAHCRSCWATSLSATSTTAPPCGCWPYGSALDSYSKVSRRPHWPSMFQHCLRAAGTSFVGILTVIAGVVTIVWPISSIVALAIVAGAWLVVVGITEVVWALSARRTVKKGERRIEESLAPSAASRLTSVGLGTTTSRAQGDWHMDTLTVCVPRWHPPRPAVPTSPVL